MDQKVGCTLVVIGLALLQVSPCAGQVKFNLTGAGVPTPAGAVWIVSGDFNGDGHADVATANAGANSVSVFLGNGDGTFHAPTNYSLSGGCEPSYLVVGDFNNDHKSDLFGSCVGQGSVFVLPGHGDGTFSAPVTTLIGQIPFLGFLGEAYPTAAIADFNGDGILDVVLQTLPIAGSNNLISTGILLLLGKGDGSFKLSPPTINLGGQNPFQIASGDFNGDGKADLAVVTLLQVADGSGSFNITSASLQIGIGDGKGDFTFAAPLNLNNLPDFVMTTGDMNGDGKIDIVLAGPPLTTIGSGGQLPSTGIVIFLGRGDGTFQQMPVQPDPIPSVPLALILADVQHTGKPDVVAVALQSAGLLGSGAIAVYPNPGNGTLQPPVITPEASGLVPLSLTVADVNGDGFADVITIAIPVAFLNNLQSNSNGLLPLQGILAQFPSATLQFLENQTLPSTFTDANSATY